MKFTAKERKVVEMLRQLDPQQNRQFVEYLERQAMANAVTARVSGLGRVRTVPDRRIEKAFGSPPWKLPKKLKPDTPA